MAREKRKPRDAPLTEFNYPHHHKINKMQKWAWGVIGSQRWHWHTAKEHQLPEIQVHGRHETVPARSRDAKSFHLPAWLPSLRAGGYGSKTHPLPRPVRGHTKMRMVSSGNDAAPGAVHDGFASSNAAGTAGQDNGTYNSGSDDDDRTYICKPDMPGC